jgi:hypothetical protein
MRYVFRFTILLTLPALAVGVLAGPNLIGGSVSVAEARTKAPRQAAPRDSLRVRPGMELTFELPDAVRVVNPKPIVSPSQRYRYGDTCHVEAGRRADVLALTKEKAPRALLRLRAASKKDSRFNCPADTLFFLPVKAIREMLKQRQERLAREAAEKDLVRRLLRQQRSR